MPTHPEVLWAQRSSDSDEEKNIINLTVNLPNIHEDTLVLDIKSDSIYFKAKAGLDNDIREYEFKLDLYKEIVPEKTRRTVSSRHVFLVLQKKEKTHEYWPRLSREKQKLAFVKTDFDKWVDEDEQDTEGLKSFDNGDMEGMPDMSGMGMPGMSGMGMPGMSGMSMPDMSGMPPGMSMPGMGGNPDLEKLLDDLKKQKGTETETGVEAPDSDSESDENPPELEEVENA